MKVGIKVLPRKEVLDTQGRAVEKLLKHNGKSVEECRVGKFIEIDVNANSREEAEKSVREIADYVLYNPLIETYELEIYEN